MVKIYKIRENIDLSRLGPHASKDIRWTEAQVEEDARNFEMTTEDFIAEFLEVDHFFDDKKMEEKEEVLAGVLFELVSLGWTDEEAHKKPEIFFEQIKEAADGMTQDAVWKVWNYVWEQAMEEIKENQRYRLDIMSGNVMAYRITPECEPSDEKVWEGTLEDAGTYEGDPDWQDKLFKFFEDKLGIMYDQWKWEIS